MLLTVHVSTQSIDWNTEQLWYHNTYIASWKDPISGDYKFILYFLVSIILFLGAIYNAWSLVSDFNAVRHDQLHTKWHLFRKEQSGHIGELASVAAWNDFNELSTRIYEVYWDLLGYDTVGWVVSSILSGFFELGIQLNALFLYNGYSILEPEHVQFSE